MALYISSRLIGILITFAGVAFLKWASGISWQAAALAYLLIWVALYDGRYIAKGMQAFEQSYHANRKSEL